MLSILTGKMCNVELGINVKQCFGFQKWGIIANSSAAYSGRNRRHWHAADKACDFAALDMQNHIGKLDEGRAMGDNDPRHRKRSNRTRNQIFGFDVEIGRAFIKEQYVGITVDRPGEQHPLPLP